MGREIKRVPLDFDWPLHVTWEGYYNPFYHPDDCLYCDKTGYSKQAKRLHDQWYGNATFNPQDTGSTPFNSDNPAIVRLAQKSVKYGYAFESESRRLTKHFNSAWCHHLDQDDVDALWKDGRLSDFNPNWTKNHNEGIQPPLASEVNQWSISGMGHDAINEWICTREKCKRLGYPLTCKHCEGHGFTWSSVAAKNLAESWVDIQPPVGEGWQLWETTSEGSPITPVFETSDSFVQYLVGKGYSLASAEAFVKQGWAMSMGQKVDSDGTINTYKDIESVLMTNQEDGDNE